MLLQNNCLSDVGTRETPCWAFNILPCVWLLPAPKEQTTVIPEPRSWLMQTKGFKSPWSWNICAVADLHQLQAESSAAMQRSPCRSWFANMDLGHHPLSKPETELFLWLWAAAGKEGGGEKKKKSGKSLKQPNQGKIASSHRVTVCRALPSLIVTIKQLLHTKTESVGKLSLLLNEMEKGETALDTRFFLAEGSNYIPVIKGFQAHK